MNQFKWLFKIFLNRIASEVKQSKVIYISSVFSGYLYIFIALRVRWQFNLHKVLLQKCNRQYTHPVDRFQCNFMDELKITEISKCHCNRHFMSEFIVKLSEWHNKQQYKNYLYCRQPKLSDQYKIVPWLFLIVLISISQTQR